MQLAQLTINHTKTQYTTKGAPHPDIQNRYTNHFQILGSTPTHINNAIDNHDLPESHAGTTLTANNHDIHLLTAQSHFYSKLTNYHDEKLLSTPHTFQLLRNYNNNTPIYQGRSHHLHANLTTAWDTNTHTQRSRTPPTDHPH